MKVKRLNTKKAGALHPDLAGLIDNIKDCEDVKLHIRLKELLPHNTPWQYPRGDMHHWVPVLDKFDAIYEAKIQEYGIDTVQTKEFSEEDKQLLLEILRVEKLIMDNATSRKIFASYDRLCELMSTSDLDVLQAVLALLHRPAQQYSNVTTFELNENATIQGRLLMLTTAGGAWGRLKENGWGLLQLAQAVDKKGDSKDSEASLNLPDTFFHIQAQFYRPTQVSASGDPQTSSASPDTKELLQPTSELRLGSQEQRLTSPSASDKASGAGNPFETPTKQTSSSNTAQKGRIATLSGAEPSTPQAAPAPSSPSAGTVTKTPWSHAFTNQDGLTKLSLFSGAFADLARNGKWTPHQVLAELLKEHPELQGSDMKDVHFEILSRLECMMAVAAPDGKLSPEKRQHIAKLLAIRLTAMSIYIHVVNEDVAQTELFLHEPTIVGQLAELVQPSSRVGDSIVTAALLVDDACLRYRTKVTEVFSSLNANVAHGILMTFFRDLIKRLATEEDVPYPLVDATLAFFSLAVVSPTHGSMLIGAGIIPALIELIKDTNSAHGGYVARAIGLMDTIIYTNPNVFGLFVNAGGLEVLNSRITIELEKWLSSSAMDETISESELVRRTVPLKLMFRSIHRLMQSGGTAEGLRNLIDSELPKSLLKTLQSANKLGAPVLAIAINITATFVHNEPTSLPIIQEMKLPEAMYDALENNKYPSYEVISTIPYALGALCLNQAGMDFVLGRPQLIRLLVNSPTNPAYRDVLKERDNAAYLGSSLDELARHHTPLKAVLHEALFDMLRSLAKMGQRARWAGLDKVADYNLILDTDQSTSGKSQSAPKMPAPEEDVEQHMDVVLWLSSQLMSGLFHNPHLAKDFLAQGGLELVLNLYQMPCLVSQFSTTETANHMQEVFRNLAEADLAKVLEGIVTVVKTAMVDNPALEWHANSVDTAITTRLLHPASTDELEKVNGVFRKMVSLNNLLGLLSSLYSTVGFSHGKVATAFLMALGAADSSTLIADMGKLHRSAIWQNIWLKAKQSPTRPAPQAVTQLRTVEEHLLSPAVEYSSSDLAANMVSPTEAATGGPSEVDEPSGHPAGAVLPENYISLKYLFSRTSLHLTTFFQGVIKMLLFRKIDPIHRIHSVPTSDQLAAMLVEHLNHCSGSAHDTLSVAGKAAIISVVSAMLYEGWTASLNVQTMLLVSFQKKGGITAVGHLLTSQLSVLGSNALFDSPVFKTDRAALLRVLAGLGVVFDLVRTLVAARPLVESPQTVILTTKDKEPDQEDYFSPYEFLTKIRLDLADPIWQSFSAPWLNQCPSPIVRSITKAALQLIEPVVGPSIPAASAPPTSSIGGLSSTLAALGFPTSRTTSGTTASVHPDPTYVDMLVQMGFTRGAAEISLRRTNNVFPSAAYYIVQHHHQLAAIPDGERAVEADAQEQPSGAAMMTALSASSGVEVSEHSPETSSEQSVTPASTSRKVAAKAIAEGRKAHLEQRRKLYRKTLPARAIELVEVHNDLVFEFAQALLEDVSSVSAVMEAIQVLSPEDPTRDAKLQARLRLFAVIAHQPAFGNKVTSEKSSQLVESLQSIQDVVLSPRPPWVSAKLLAIDCLLMWGESIKAPPAEGAEIGDDIVAGPRYEQARRDTLVYATKLLLQPDLNEDEMLAVLRTLVFLTRDKSSCQLFLESSGLSGLFKAILATPAKRRHSAMAFATIICRHLIEDEAVLQTCITREVHQWFARPRNAAVNAKHFVSNLRSVALRDPSIFLKVATTDCELLDPEPRAGGHQISLKKKSNDAANASAQDEALPEQASQTEAMQIDDPFQATTDATGSNNSPLEQVMSFLINEIFAIHKTQSTAADTNAVVQDAKQTTENQLSSILLVLTELLGSYNESKISMVQPSKKTGKDVGSANKMRSPVLQILLSSYVCNIVFDADVTRASGDKVTDAQKARMNVSNWAGAVIVALCSDATGSNVPKDASTTIVSIRKTVMDNVAKAIKEISNATDPLNLRYGRLWALSELCYRLLTARPTVQAKHQDDSSLHVAKIMLEKGFVPILTTAMAEIDLTYPQVKNLITAIVQPLEYLTKISMKMARPDKAKPTDAELSEDESMSSGSESEDEDMEDDDASTDAPDMYRNSSLGMFGGEMDDYLEDSDGLGDDDEEDDLDHYEEVEGMDDESENGTEPSESESDEELEHWDGHMDHDDHIEGDDAFPDDDENADQESVQYGLFDDPAHDPIDQEDAEGYAGDEVYLEDEMEEDEQSENSTDYDEEELDALDTVVVDPLSATPHNGPTLNWGWGQPVRTQSREDTQQQHRNHRSLQNTMSLMDDIGPFHRSHPPQAPVASLTSHPLLQQEGIAGTTQSHRGRPHRHYPGGAIGEILQSIEQLTGGASHDGPGTFENLLDQLGGRTPDVVRIEYHEDGRTGGAVDIQVGGGHRFGSSRRARDAAPVDPEAFSSIPLPTINRWQEEETLMNSYDTGARLNNLTGWIVHALLPAAREAQKKLNERIEEARRETEARLKKEAEEKAEKEAEAERQRLQEEAEERERRAQEPVTEAEAPQPQDVEMANAVDSATETPATRIIVRIHGAEVDITDTGIDPEFLEALPEDMRADVVSQHLRDNRVAEPQSQPAISTEISPEFLDALPPEIRAEVIQQEAIEAARRSAESRAGTGQGPAGSAAAEDMAGLPDLGDLRNFFSTLDPGMRNVVMMEQDDAFFAALPPHLRNGLVALSGGNAGNGLRDEMARLAAGGFRPRSHGHGVQHRGSQSTSQQKKAPRETIQLLDKPGIAALVRLLFFPDINKKDRLLKVLANLCENTRSRSDVVSILLSVLQDDSGDLSYVDKQSVAKASKGALTTPKATPKKKGSSDNTTSSAAMLAGLQSDSIPTFVAQRAFEALAYIASSNAMVLLYFLTEQEMPVISTKTTKKGKGKDRQTAPSYPIAALLKLLDRQSLFRTPEMAETLTALLATLTKPLTQLSAANQATDANDATVSQPVETRPVIDAAETAATSVADAASQQETAAQPTAAESTSDAMLVTGDQAKPAGDAGDDSTTLLKSPPNIAEDILKLVPNVLTFGDCSSRTFSSTLALIQNLTHIPSAKEVISAQLQDQAQRLGDVLSKDLEQLHTDLLDAEKADMEREVSVGKFSPASSAQTKLLRVLKTIDYIYAPKDGHNHARWDASVVTAIAEGTKSLDVEEEHLESIFDSMHFAPLWETLGNCLSVVERKDSLINIATVLLPLVESLMVVSKYGSAKAAASRTRGGSVALSPTSPREAVEEDSFVVFTSRHRKVLNTMVRNNPSLMSGSFSLLILNPRVLEFDNKRNWFMQQLRKKPSRDVGGQLHLNIRREHIFEDSYRALLNKSGDTLKYGKLNIKFSGEEGVDAGGVTREWYSALAQSIFNPGYCLFEPCAADEGTYQLSQHSWVNGDHLDYFRFIGKIIAKAIYDQRLLDAYFSRAFYKQILGRKVDVRDLESVDPEYHKSLVWMLNNDITGIIELDFSLETEEFGAKKVIDLKEGGSDIPVTEDNKAEYVRLVVEHRLETSIQKQAKAFLGGFYEIIPRKLVSVFDPDQLELLISGVSQIDVDELKNATQLHGWKHTDAEVTWFWRALRSFSQEEKAKFLMFVTSSSRVPLGGFTQLQGSSGIQPFQIHKLYRENVLPSAATCFNELLLPSFPSYEDLRHKLLTAISEGAGHFGLA